MLKDAATMNERAARVGDVFETRYELLEVLGSGGIGTVFKARQLDAERLIALKVLHADVAADGEFKLRFMREAQALSKLSHESIVTVYHLGLSESGVPYLAMELIKGSSLRKSIAEGAMPQARVFSVARQLCSALAYIHEAGIVHRDLKPENIVFLEDSETDQVKIIDFGLARFDLTQDGQKLTSTGALLGSVYYMSPEQCKGLKADARSDLYSLAVCIFEMLSGSPPFDSDNPMGLMYKHVHAEIPQLGRQNTSQSFRKLNEFFKKGLSKEPEKRFQNAVEMERAIQDLSEIDLPASSADDKQSGAADSRRIVIPVLLIVFVLLAGAFVVSSFATKALMKDKTRASNAVNNNDPRARMNALLIRKDVSNVQKIQTLMLFVKQYGFTGNEELLAELERLVKQEASNRPGKQVKLYFDMTILLFDYGLLEKAVPYIESFFKSVNKLHLDDYGLGADNYWTMKGFLCRAYSRVGRNKEAMAAANEIAANPVSGDAEAMQTALEWKDEALIQRLLANQTNANHYLSLCRIFRAYGRSDLASYCLERAAKLPMPRNAALTYNLEKAKLEYFSGKIAEAKSTVVCIYNDSELEDYFADGRRYRGRYELTLLLELLGMHKEALDVGFRGRNGDDKMLLLKAYLLAEDKKFDEARQYLLKDKSKERMAMMLSILKAMEGGTSKVMLLDLKAMPL